MERSDSISSFRSCTEEGNPFNPFGDEDTESVTGSYVCVTPVGGGSGGVQPFDSPPSPTPTEQMEPSRPPSRSETPRSFFRRTGTKRRAPLPPTAPSAVPSVAAAAHTTIHMQLQDFTPATAPTEPSNRLLRIVTCPVASTEPNTRTSTIPCDVICSNDQAASPHLGTASTKDKISTILDQHVTGTVPHVTTGSVMPVSKVTSGSPAPPTPQRSDSLHIATTMALSNRLIRLIDEESDSENADSFVKVQSDVQAQYSVLSPVISSSIVSACPRPSVEILPMPTSAQPQNIIRPQPVTLSAQKAIPKVSSNVPVNKELDDTRLVIQECENNSEEKQLVQLSAFQPVQGLQHLSQLPAEQLLQLAQLKRQSVIQKIDAIHQQQSVNQQQKQEAAQQLHQNAAHLQQEAACQQQEAAQQQDAACQQQEATQKKQDAACQQQEATQQQECERQQQECERQQQKAEQQQQQEAAQQQQKTAQHQQEAACQQQQAARQQQEATQQQQQEVALQQQEVARQQQEAAQQKQQQQEAASQQQRAAHQQQQAVLQVLQAIQQQQVEQQQQQASHQQQQTLQAIHQKQQTLHQPPLVAHQQEQNLSQQQTEFQQQQAAYKQQQTSPQQQQAALFSEQAVKSISNPIQSVVENLLSESLIKQSHTQEQSANVSFQPKISDMDGNLYQNTEFQACSGTPVHGDSSMHTSGHVVRGRARQARQPGLMHSASDPGIAKEVHGRAPPKYPRYPGAAHLENLCEEEDTVNLDDSLDGYIKANRGRPRLKRSDSVSTVAHLYEDILVSPRLKYKVTLTNITVVVLLGAFVCPNTAILLFTLFRLVFGTLFPAYYSYKAVKTKNVKEYVKWMMYWIVFAFFTCFETITDLFLSFWFPFYYELKILVVLWLLSPATRGSSILYRKFVHPWLTRREEDIDDCIAKAKQQGYSTVIQLGTKGANYVTTVLMQTAIKGGGGIVNQLRRSYSSGELNEGDLNRNVKALPPHIQDEDDFDGHYDISSQLSGTDGLEDPTKDSESQWIEEKTHTNDAPRHIRAESDGGYRPRGSSTGRVARSSGKTRSADVTEFYQDNAEDTVGRRRSPRTADSASRILSVEDLTSGYSSCDLDSGDLIYDYKHELDQTYRTLDPIVEPKPKAKVRRTQSMNINSTRVRRGGAGGSVRSIGESKGGGSRASLASRDLETISDLGAPDSYSSTGHHPAPTQQHGSSFRRSRTGEISAYATLPRASKRTAAKKRQV